MLAKISQGLSNNEIGFQLGITGQTVKIHIRAIREKLNIHSRVELALVPIGVQVEQMFHTIFETGLRCGILMGVIIGEDLVNDDSPDVEQIIKEHFNAN